MGPDLHLRPTPARSTTTGHARFDSGALNASSPTATRGGLPTEVARDGPPEEEDASRPLCLTASSLTLGVEHDILTMIQVVRLVDCVAECTPLHVLKPLILQLPAHHGAVDLQLGDLLVIAHDARRAVE